MSSIPNPYESAGVVIPTTSTTTCVPNYQSITLQAGNKFILPPGATIISVSDVTKIQSDCADLTNIEEPVCYAVSFSGVENTETETENWEYANFKFDGIKIGDVFYPLGVVTDPPTNAASIVSNINVAFPGMFTCWNWGTHNEGSYSGGWTTIFSFKTIPSIGNDLYFRAYTDPAWQSGIGPKYIYAKAVPDATIGGSYGCSC